MGRLEQGKTLGYSIGMLERMPLTKMIFFCQQYHLPVGNPGDMRDALAELCGRPLQLHTP
jgi:hypothetical protein